jgi:glycerophosphoryl diester phosphodiesterase
LVTLVAVTVVVVVLPLTSLTTPASAATTGCAYAAHRGYHAHATENSLRAMQAAVRRNADYLEMDVQVTSDGHFALMHDRTIDRTSRGTGQIPQKTWTQLRRSLLNDGQHVPSLGGVLRMARPTPVQVLLEMKWIPDSRFALLRKRIETFGASRVVVHSFDKEAVRRFHALYPEVRTAVDVSGPITVEDAVSYGGVLPDHRNASLEWLAALREAAVPVYLWTLDSTSSWEQFTGLVDVVVTDRAATYDPYRRTHCPTP